MNEVIGLLRRVENEFEQLSRNYQKMSEKNSDFFRILATVKNELEKTLKRPETLKETVYGCIDLLRKNTPYYSATEGINKIDPPLTEEQKTL